MIFQFADIGEQAAVDAAVICTVLDRTATIHADCNPPVASVICVLSTLRQDKCSMATERQDVGKLRLRFVDRGAAQIGHPVIEEIVGLGFQRVGADGDNDVGELGILIACPGG